jgi:hypothetical protein
MKENFFQGREQMKLEVTKQNEGAARYSSEVYG